MASHLDLLGLARQAAEQAGSYLRTVERPVDPATWTRKGKSDFVTVVDRTAEEIIHRVLLEGEPGSRIIGEELAPEIVKQGLVWVVDPLDGTTNFLHGIAAHAVSIAAAVDGDIVAGVVLEVPVNRMYHATRGGGAWCGPSRLTVSPNAAKSDALIATGFPYTNLERLDEYLDQLRRVVQETSGIRRAGAAALDLALVAAGSYEGFWEQRLSAWDIAAGMLLVREAGGRVTDYIGRDLGIEHASVVAGNPPIHQWLVEVLTGA
ncbi:MAG: inositol monophosphatase family protein [Gemmatimonadota bacterium]